MSPEKQRLLETLIRWLQQPDLLERLERSLQEQPEIWEDDLKSDDAPDTME